MATRMTLTLAGAALALGAAGCGTGTSEFATEGVGRTVQRAPLDRRVAQWPAESRTAALAMNEKYGAPDEQTATMLVWHGNGPWKRTIVYRDPVPHAFPRPHTDLLEQFIDYRVPPELYDELAAYDGSVIVERTKGEISARCDKEEMNFLALNLANDIATGRRTVADARREYARQATAFLNGRPAPYTERLLFDMPRGGTADPDAPLEP